MLNRAQLLQLDNCPTNIDAQFLCAEWLPQVNFAENQKASKNEQRLLLNHLCASVRAKLMAVSDSRLAKNDLMLSPPGSGKNYLSRVVLSYAWFNGFKCMITSLAARRSQQLGGEHIHRLFRVTCAPFPAKDLAEKALVNLSRDLKRKNFLERLQFMLIEEKSLLNAEKLSAVNLILKRLKENDEEFGGVYILANGDSS